MACRFHESVLFFFGTRRYCMRIDGYMCVRFLLVCCGNAYMEIEGIIVENGTF